MRLELVSDGDVDLAAKFEAFWQHFPRRVGKLIAKAKFMQICTVGLKTRALDKSSGEYVPIDIPPTDPDLIIEAAKRFHDSCLDRSASTYGAMKDGGRYIPHPSTWLGQGRFLD